MNSKHLTLVAAGLTLAATSVNAQLMDFGDAPTNFPTLGIHDGARHLPGPFPVLLGMLRDFESDGFPSPGADGDDLDAMDDEDGVTFLDPLVPGRTARVRVHVNAPNAAYLDAWIDFNRDGQWTHLEKIFTSWLLPTGVHHLRITVPRRAMLGPTYARFRLSSEGGLPPFGQALSGEVEDYRVVISPPLTVSPMLHLSPTPGGVTVNWGSPQAVLQTAPTLEGPWSVDLEAVGAATYGNDLGSLFFRTIEIPGLQPNPSAESILPSLAHAADLVFDGTVVEVAYRNSSPLPGGDVMPHTFVTFAVNEVLKGRVALTEENGNSVPAPLCLRFAGGWDEEDESVMLISRHTLFDAGERSILFVRLNDQVAQPLIAGNLGRYRVVNNEMFTAMGSELVLTPADNVVVGA